MTELDDVIACQDALLAALDARNVDAIELASKALADAVAKARVQESVIDQSIVRDQLDHGLKQNDAARARVNILADWNRQKIDRLAELRGTSSAKSYSIGRI